MLPDWIPAASAISRTVVARKPFCANSSPASRIMSARRCDRAAPLAPGAVARSADWLLRVALTASLLPAGPAASQALARLAPGTARSACQMPSRRAGALSARRMACGQGSARLISQCDCDQQLLAGRSGVRVRLHQEPALQPAAALDQQFRSGTAGQPASLHVVWPAADLYLAVVL